MYITRFTNQVQILKIFNCGYTTHVSDCNCINIHVKIETCTYFVSEIKIHNSISVCVDNVFLLIHYFIHSQGSTHIFDAICKSVMGGFVYKPYSWHSRGPKTDYSSGKQTRNCKCRDDQRKITCERVPFLFSFS